MLWTLYVISAYLTYYTFRYARTLWQNSNKLGAVATGILALSFLPLCIIIVRIN